MSPLFLSLIPERQIQKHIYREKHRESDNIERNKVQGYGSNCKSVNKLNRVKNNKGNVSSTFMLMFSEVVNVSSIVSFPTRGKCHDARQGNRANCIPDGLEQSWRSSRWIWGWRRSADRTRGLRRQSVVGSSWSTSIPWKRKMFKVRVWSGLRSESNSGKDLLVSIYYTISTTARTELPNCMVHVGASDRKRWSPTPTCKCNRGRTWRQWKLWSRTLIDFLWQPK